MSPRTQQDGNPLVVAFATGLAFLSMLFLPTPRRARPVAVLPAPPLPTPLLASGPAEISQPEPTAFVRPAPTPLGLRVLAALDGRDPMRKCEVAALVGIGRGSANRMVDRLSQAGWVRHAGEGLYVVV